MSCLTPRINTLVLVCGMLTFQAATAADDMTVNRLLASQCAQCHGTNGHSVGDIDSLAGGDEISGELNEMRNKSNPNDIMEHQAMGYTSDQIRRIAAYYATVSKNGGSTSGGSGGNNSGNSGGSDSGSSGGSDSGGSGGSDSGGSGGSDSGSSGGSDSGSSGGNDSGSSGGSDSGSSNDSSNHDKSRNREKSRQRKNSERRSSRHSD